MTMDLDFAQAVLAAQPFNQLVGARLTRFEAGEATLEIEIRKELTQQNGHLHGGVLAYAADNALTFAAGSALGPAVLTSGLTISYLRPAHGRTLLAQAKIVHAGRRQAVARCDLLTVDGEDGEDGERRLCAVAQGTTLALQPPVSA